MSKLIGPFTQLLTMRDLRAKGAIQDDELEVIQQAGILIGQAGKVVAVGEFEKLFKEHRGAHIVEIERDSVAIPGMVDCHTHTCFAGSRRRDYALRVSGKSYQEILAQGGGIYDTVEKTRQASEKQLIELLADRLQGFLESGITTIEIKSGYGLDDEHETKMLRAIQEAAKHSPIAIVATCLAAHVPPKDKDPKAYLEHLSHSLLPQLKQENLCHRVDVFMEEHAFSYQMSLGYLLKAKQMGFGLTVHADQFSTGGSRLAVAVGADSADHLEASGAHEAELLSGSDVVAVALPGASLGLGMRFAPARMLLDKGCCLAIASDFNPGSAPNGDLLAQAAFLGAAEKLTLAETLAAITSRAALALKKAFVGQLDTGYFADIVAFPTDDYREILYWQGRLRPNRVWCKGQAAWQGKQ